MPHNTLIEERVVDGESHFKTVAEHKARYEFAKQFAIGARVLDAACGSGYGTRMLWNAGAAEVVGIDCDPETIEYARYRYGITNISFLEGDVLDPPNLAPFDTIVSFETIEHVERPDRFLQICHELLAPGGRLIVSTPYRHRMRPDGRPLNPFHKQEWRTAEFADLLRPYFSHVKLFGQALKVQKRMLLPLSRSFASAVARIQGVRLKCRENIFRLPPPRLFGLWKTFPAYLIAVCRRSSSM